MKTPFKRLVNLLFVINYQNTVEKLAKTNLLSYTYSRDCVSAHVLHFSSLDANGWKNGW